MSEEITVKCKGCGRQRDPDVVHNRPRKPCPDCGELAVQAKIISSITVGFNVSHTALVEPGRQGRDWRQRWTNLKCDLPKLANPKDGSISSPEIETASQELHSFLIQAYHLKDALIADAPNTGISKQQVEDAVTKTTALALLADIANLDKHGSLNRPPRSGKIPKFIRAIGKEENGKGWMLIVEYEHDSKTKTGLQIAEDAVNAWRQLLTAWGLL